MAQKFELVPLEPLENLYKYREIEGKQIVPIDELFGKQPTSIKFTHDNITRWPFWRVQLLIQWGFYELNLRT
ncbi:hypothetical protein [Flavobacterium sp. '19STA2R22 D10 B1']|uniref:hypothetical protein n=1 Tax=Flavobacterium aerium TaxID=3037261 RepID=UPI00278C8DB6|nr:hypothetical protein [Flavobacterium sp. '19STA2R22 D10 B1']